MLSSTVVSRHLLAVVTGLAYDFCAHYQPENTKEQNVNIRRNVKRLGHLARIRPEKVSQYMKHHAEIPPEVANSLTDHHIQNLSVWVKELERGEPYAFSYCEYGGNYFESEFAHLDSLPVIKKWRDAVEVVCLIESVTHDDYWVPMEEVFFFDGMVEQPVEPAKVGRFGQVIGVRPALVDSYKLIHRYAWPEVLHAIRRGKIRNYSIYLTTIGEKVYIFGYLEHVGDDFDTDMAEIAGDPANKAWLKFTDEVCQLPIPTREVGEWWANMEEVYYQP